MGKMRTSVLNRNQKIRDQFDKEIKKGYDVETTISNIASQLDIGKFYIRSILKDQGLDIKRKSTYNRKDKKELVQRDANIKHMLLVEGRTILEISIAHDITETRVRQITKGLINKSTDYTKEIEDIKRLIADGSSYNDILEKYDRDTIKSIKTKSGFNAYREVLKHQNSAIIKLFKNKMAPLDIAKKFGLTRDSVYLILKNNGHTSRMTKDEKIKRDKEIVALSKNKVPIPKIASKYELTSAMVRIILNNKK